MSAVNMEGPGAHVSPLQLSSGQLCDDILVSVCARVQSGSMLENS